jgi:hypothetical protein
MKVQFISLSLFTLFSSPFFTLYSPTHFHSLLSSRPSSHKLQAAENHFPAKMFLASLLSLFASQHTKPRTFFFPDSLRIPGMLTLLSWSGFARVIFGEAARSLFFLSSSSSLLFSHLPSFVE